MRPPAAGAFGPVAAAQSASKPLPFLDFTVSIVGKVNVVLGRDYQATIPFAVVHVRAVAIRVLGEAHYSILRLWGPRRCEIRIGSLAIFGLYSEEVLHLLLRHPNLKFL